MASDYPLHWLYRRRDLDPTDLIDLSDEGVWSLDHQCGAWEIGDEEDVRQFCADLLAALDNPEGHKW